MKMIDVQKIKQAFLEEGLTKSQICKKYHYCWGTVSKVQEGFKAKMDSLQTLREQNTSNLEDSLSRNEISFTEYACRITAISQEFNANSLELMKETTVKMIPSESTCTVS